MSLPKSKIIKVRRITADQFTLLKELGYLIIITGTGKILRKTSKIMKPILRPIERLSGNALIIENLKELRKLGLI